MIRSRAYINLVEMSLDGVGDVDYEWGIGADRRRYVFKKNRDDHHLRSNQRICEECFINLRIDDVFQAMMRMSLQEDPKEVGEHE